MKWRKLGQLYSVDKLHPKLFSHAANPLPIHLNNNVFRIFFSARDENNRSSVGAVDIDIVEGRIMNEIPEPVFEYGPKGSFFDSGVSIGNVYEVGGQQYILFMGWQNPDGGHWRGDVGQLELLEDLKLKLVSDVPFMASDSEDPVSLSYPWVTRFSDQDYYMWYGSTLSWDAGNDEMLHAIKGARSEDGIVWQKTGLQIPYEIGVAQAFSKPTVAMRGNGILDMWFSYRSGGGTAYRIGRAEKKPQGTWSLCLDDAGIDVSETGWDSEMIAYPYVFDHDGDRFMLYNGNRYGKSGFGLAILERD
ncbi:MAG: hypothetical protein ACR2O3_03980 [Rhizobiaceae bacterium]